MIIKLFWQKSTFFVEDWNSLSDEKNLSFLSFNILICEIDFVLNLLNQCKIKKHKLIAVA